ncbi:MAG: T9SS type A sorting domain-containing protein [Bacteroidales bacterium]
MKKLLLSTAILIASLSASAQNLIQHGDFTGVTTMTEAGALYRIANLTDLGKDIQLNNPTAEAVTVVAGEWYKKSKSAATLIANVVTDLPYGGATVSAVNLKKTNIGPDAYSQNQLTQFVSLTEGETYVLSFDIQTEDKANNYDNLYLEMRAIVGTGTQAFASRPALSMTDATYFTDLGNGWMRFQTEFKAQSTKVGTEDYKNSIFVLSKDATDEQKYSYYVTNVTLEKSIPSSNGSANESKAKIYAAGKTVRVEGANGTVEVYNVAGQLVKQVVCEENVSFEMNSKGIFVVKVKEANASKTVKIVL